MRRTNIHAITFTARCESGLHIGGSQDELAIGGADNPVIKNPANSKPYIPGSSLKGKMRGELEKQLGKFGRDGSPEGDRPCGCAGDDCPICRVFGAHMNARSQLGPSRILVRDGELAGGFDIENKTENVINRRSGAAQHPRSNERVATGAEFGMSVILQVFEADADFRYTDLDDAERAGDAALQAVVADGLRLVEKTGLGGGISRGSGAVSFHGFEMDGEAWTLWQD